VPDPRPEDVQFATAWLAAEEESGRQYGPALLAMATGEWRSEMKLDENLRRYGTLRFLLGVIRNDLFQYPIQARERAAVVIEYTEEVDVPSPHYYYFLGGLAWKEYANALRYAGEFPLALAAAKRSREIFGMVGSLACDAAKAHLVEALVHREFGDLDTALSIATKCAQVFLDHADSEAYMHARMTEALVLSDTKRFDEAMEILTDTGRDAEKRGDKRTLAICLHNSAECARALRDLQAARTLDALALTHFEELGTTVEKPRIRWMEARALADEGQLSAAILQLRITRSEFLSLGMNGSAAACGLDIVRLRHDRDEDVTSECTELIETLTGAGMIQPAIEALAYLREQARRGTVSTEKIVAVQTFVHEAGKGQARMFVPPPEHGA
jgi:tetratricopeptide (TPR) repeat protein